MESRRSNLIGCGSPVCTGLLAALLALLSASPIRAQLSPSATPTLTPIPSTATIPSTTTRTRTSTATPVPVPDALFVTQSVPSAMMAGQQYMVSVTMQNAGTTTWTAAQLYRLGAFNPYDNTTWGMNRVGLAAGDSIAPGQQKTFSWTVTAPVTPATYNFQWRMVRDGVTWFGAASTNVAVGVSGSYATFVTQSVPSSMAAGQMYPVSVTLRNTGTTTWTPAGLYRLGAFNPYDNTTWGADRVGLAATDNIAPGQQKTFAWNVTAPSGAGMYNFQWRMVQDGVTWFGVPSTNVAVNVTTTPDAAFVTQSVPTTMVAGQPYAVSLTMRNTGGTAWTPAGLFRLGAFNPYDNTTWGTSRVDLDGGDSIGAAQLKTFMWTVAAPNSPGTYNFQWRMVQEGVTWFGAPSTNIVVTATPSSAPDALFVGQSVAAPMIVGQPYSVSVTMRNIGGTTWTAAGRYRLGAFNPYDNVTWGTNRIGLDAGDSIAPGQEKTFAWTVTAPSSLGTHNFQWRMVQEGVTWFGASSTNLPINVGAVSALGTASLRFFGTGSGDIDRVKIPLDVPNRPVDVGGDFTLEWWMKADSGNLSGACVPGGDDWMDGNVLFDRDVFGDGDFGDYGVSLFGTGGNVAFGVDRLGSGTTICGAANVADGAWHHLAATRNATTGQLRLFVDGQPDGTPDTGPTGDVSYRDGRSTTQPNSDPFLVIGAEKRDTGLAYHGWVDEMRVSNVVRYTAAFTRPSAPFASDPHTVALYHFGEGNGDAIIDESGAAGGPSNGVLETGGPSQGPQWSTDVPFPTAAPSIALQTLTTSLTSPTSITHCGDGRLFITELGGTIRIWDGAELLPTPFLTVAPIASGGEQGLLSVAFHPNYAQNGLFFVYYTNSSGNPTIARYHVSADPNVADPSSGVTLLTVNHPGQTNHNGGQLQFGLDGYLYAGTGDGGGGCDSSGPGCNAQRDDSLLGKMLRLDVDQNVDTPPYYGIPDSNPFKGPGDPLDEIWAKGLRNPFRFSFDRLTGSQFIGDVGQDTREEVDIQAAGSPGGRNYGWKRMEGFLCNTCDLSNCPVAPPPCDDPSLTLPVLDYGHNPECAIIGGYVYRGLQIPFLYGKYLYTDLCSGRLWWANDHEGTWMSTPFTPTASQPWSFGRDVNGELYLVQGDGTLAKILPGP